MKRLPLLALLLAVVSLALVLPLQVVRADGGGAATVTPEPSLDYTQFLADESQASPEPSLTSVLVGVLWKLGVVVLLAYGALWLIKRFSVRRVVSGGQQLQVLETVGLGANRSLHLVRVGPQVLLLGATQQEVRTLGDVSNSYDSDEPWGEAELDVASADAEAPAATPERTLMPSLEAIERVRRLWRRGES